MLQALTSFFHHRWPRWAWVGLGALVLAGVGVFVAKVTLAGLEWEIQKPPETYQQQATAFRSIEFVKNETTDKYYGWAVGDAIPGTQATLLYYNGSFWDELFDSSATEPGAFKNLSDVAHIWYDHEDRYLVWAVGEDGTIWYLPDGVTVCSDDGVPCSENLPVDLTAVEAVDALDSGADFSVFVGANDVIYKAQGTSSSDVLAFGTSFSVDGLVTDISAVDPTHLWAVTDAGKIYFNGNYQSEIWTEEFAVAGYRFTGISAATSDRVWASAYRVSDNHGAVFAYEGGSWSSTPQLLIDAAIQLTGVSAVYNQTLDIYNTFAVGSLDPETANGAMFQYNGSIWERQDSNDGKHNLNAVAAANLTQVRAVGDSSTIVVSSPGNIFGWLWFGTSTTGNSQDAIGWGSGSCANENYCDLAGFTYGVNVRKTGSNAGSLNGYVWLGNADADGYFPEDCVAGVCSSNPSVSCADDNDTDCSCSKNSAACISTGWLSFNKKTPDGTTDESGTPPAAPFNNPALAYIAKFDAPTGKVEGWARIMSLKDDDVNGGWVKLRGNSLTPPFSTARDCRNCGTFCSISKRKCDASSPCDVLEGSCDLNICKLCNALDDGSETGKSVSCNTCSNAGAQACSQRCENDHTISCTQDNFGTVCPGGTACLDEIFCDTCSSCDAYGVSINDATGRITGYGWSGDGTTSGELGWVDFSRANYYSQAWLQTQYGDIYARADIGSANTPSAPQDKCNATYVISAAGTITNFCTTRAGGLDPDDDELPDPNRPYFQQNFEPIFFPDQANSYTNLLGRIDVDGTTQPIAGQTKNKYGDEVVTITPPAGESATLTDIGQCKLDDVILNHTVYHIEGNFAIDSCDLGGGNRLSTWTIKNSNLPETNGSGTIVVDGDLTISINMAYESGSFSEISKLASLGIIVKGDMIVTGDVDQIVGSYLVIGDGVGPEETPRNSIEVKNSLEERPFSAQGLFIARSFKFSRTFRGTLLNPEPAEQIVYDGRVIANPPPGFRDFAKALPLIRESVPGV